ncbi:hypothetical protein SYJ56_07960 [Algoriphagus sp. D3-2-R+10]|uniref:hypothetical protein n=1 Tax=Algoriphagus aurantiacus TaxID=3103948 RepID=UPI002B3DAFC5|nr:hypothetical protein [Algoriphagus sp. D3-2-R+10]MEB2775239.1 hypothetical protein [Algoriphagus sp. D3-2-R+10]
MATLKVNKVESLPVSPVANSIYFVKSSGDTQFEMILTDSFGNPIEMNSNGVTLDTAQTITGVKNFNADITFGDTSLDYVKWDNTANTLGIFSQAQFLHKYRGGASGALNLGQYDASGNASINNTSNAGLIFGTNNTSRLEIQSDGDVLLKKVDNGAGDFVTIDATTGQLRKRTASQALSDIANPRVYVFDFATNGNPDVTAGGTYNVRYAPLTTFTTMNIGDTAKMVIKGKIQTRNAANLIGSIGGSIATGATFGLNTQNYNWSNGTVGNFTFEISNVRTGTSSYRHTIDLYIYVYDGVTNEVRHFNQTSTSATGYSGGALNGSLSIYFAEANAENELFLMSGILEIYKQTQT